MLNFLKRLFSKNIDRANVIDFCEHLGMQVWQCPCGSIDMRLQRDGTIVCSCNQNHGQKWDWK